MLHNSGANKKRAARTGSCAFRPRDSREGDHTVARAGGGEASEGWWRGRLLTAPIHFHEENRRGPRPLHHPAAPGGPPPALAWGRIESAPRGTHAKRNPMHPESPLLTDLYQLNMIQAYLDHGETRRRSSSFSSASCRRGAGFWSPPASNRRWISSKTSLLGRRDRLAQEHGRFGKDLLDHLAGFRFTGDVHAMPEGTVFFANEPILRVTAPMPQAQLVETRLINILHFQTLIAAKAARMRAGRAGQAAGRFRPAPRARRRGRADGGARELHRRLRRHRDHARRRNVRHSALRHHGAFLHRGVRRRERGVRESSRARGPTI